MIKQISAKLCAVAIAASTVMGVSLTSAQAEGYLANYEAYVVSVQPWDELNVRKWPASNSQKVGALPHDGQFVWVQRCIIKDGRSDWCKVNYAGQWGWVNKSFLAAH